MLRCKHVFFTPFGHTTTILRNGLIAIGLISASSLTSVAALAEQVKIPLGQQGNHWNVDRPRTGSSKNTVEMKFGSPLNASGPVGNPPIYTWEYANFNVYFEGDYVIHSVVKYQAQANDDAQTDY